MQTPAAGTDIAVNEGLLLGRAQGTALMGAAAVILKSLLESETAVGCVYTPQRGSFSQVLRIAADVAGREVLARHRMEVRAVRSSVRAAELAATEALRGRNACALIDARDVAAASELVARLCERGPLLGALLLIAEDDPSSLGVLCPRAIAQRSRFWCMEPWENRGIASAIDIAWKLTNCKGRPAMLIMQRELLRQSGTVELLANRVVESVDQASWLRRRQSSRGSDTNDALRVIRRAEVNRLSSLPSPGEREPLGFIAVGACALSTLHMLTELGLSTRVPLLRLGAIEPFDEAAVERLLDRVVQAIVIEAQPGTIGPRVLEVAQRSRASNPHAAMVSWSGLPQPIEGPPSDPLTLQAGDGLSTSILTRKSIHLLHQVRPGLQVASKLAPVPEGLVNATIASRGSAVGLSGIKALLAGVLDEVTHTLARRAPESNPPSFELGASRAAPGQRALAVEVWESGPFAAEGALMLGDALREMNSRVFVVLLVDSDRGSDPERLARSHAVGDGEQRLAVERVACTNRRALLAVMERAAEFEGVTLVLLRDGDPPRFDLSAGMREASALDAAGFRSMQRVVWPADAACDIRELNDAAVLAQKGGRPVSPIAREARVEKRAYPSRVRFRLRIEPILEQIEVIRTRPAGTTEALREPPRLPPPAFAHAQQGIWRVHTAGTRGGGLGFAGEVLARAGHAAGYRIDAIADESPIALARCAWSQVSFSRATMGESARAFTARIPYGEADLILGVDPIETLRALGTDPTLCVSAPERTAAVVSTAALEGEERLSDDGALLAEAVRATCHPGMLAIGDWAGVMRRSFLTDRALDLFLLGLAWQRGFIPVPVASMEAALRSIESEGAARSIEAFNLGRLSAADGAQQARAQESEERSPAQLVRMISLAGALRGVGAFHRARQLRKLVERTLREVGGIADSVEGQQAVCDLIVAIERCMIWGGAAVARRYTELVTRLHSTHGAILSAPAVLPLAEGALPRDFLYVGLMSASFEHRRRIRRALSVRAARGDTVERRYLTRIDLAFGGKRWIVDFRSSDWPSRILRAVRPLVPDRWRGSPESLARREALFRCFSLAAEDARPLRWIPFARTMHEAAVGGRLRTMRAAEILRLAPGE